MDYEKRYKEAMARLELVIRNGLKLDPAYIFPELTESEDERIRKELCEFISDTLGDEFDGYDISKDAALAYLEKQKDKCKDCPSRGNTHSYLKGYEDGQKEQKPAEWSEEDKDILESLIKLYSMQYTGERWGWAVRDKYTYGDVIKFLKSLRPPTVDALEEAYMRGMKAGASWKPSEEQMEALDNARMCKSYDYDALDSLYDNLKKLM